MRKVVRSQRCEAKKMVTRKVNKELIEGIAAETHIQGGGP